MSTPQGSSRASGRSRKRKPTDTNDKPRKRTKTACRVCRAKKSKCDGVRPVCGPCVRREGDQAASVCSYPAASPPLLVSEPRASEEVPPEPPPLHDSSQSNSAGRFTAELDDIGSGEVQNDIELQRSRSNVQPTDFDSPPNAGSPFPGQRYRVPRGRHSMKSSGEAESSQQTWRTAEETLTPRQRAGRFPTDYLTNDMLRLPRTHEVEGTEPPTTHLLPPRATADHLFKMYWKYSHIVFPCLDKDEVCREYLSLWTEPRDSNLNGSIFHCILNLIFAIASTLDPAAQSSAHLPSPTAYYARAKELLNRNLLDISHFQVLQALLLAVQYLQSTTMSQTCLRTMSLVVWMAQDLGLHSPRSTRTIMDPKDRALVHRVWHACVMMDKINAMTFGRTPLISKTTADQAQHPLPTESSDDDLPQALLSDQSPMFEFFTAFCKLHCILGDVLESLYTESDYDGASVNSNITFLSGQKMERIFQIEQALSQWSNKLGPSLQRPSSPRNRSRSYHPTRQITILHARYTYIRLLLYRRFVTQAKQFEETQDATTQLDRSTISIRIFTECQIICVEAAQQLIGILSEDVRTSDADHREDLLPEWWYMLPYVYTASMVLIVVHALPSVLGRLSPSSLDHSLDQGFQVLRHLERKTSAARRVRATLESLQKRMTRSLPANEEPLTPQPSFMRATTDEATNEPDDSQDPDGDFQTSILDTEDQSWFDSSLFEWDASQWLTSSPESNI